MIPFILLVVSMLVSATLGYCTSANSAASFKSWRSAGFVLSMFASFACVGWLAMGYAFVPREWNTRMREADRAGVMDWSNFIKGSSYGGEGLVPAYGERNLLVPRRSDRSAGKTVDLGPKSTRALGLVGGGKVLASVDLGNVPLADLQFVVFDGDRLYRFQWDQINGSYYQRRH